MTNKLDAKRYSLTIGWLYPDLMSTYGDRGNIIVLQKRCEWRNIKVNVKRISIETNAQELKSCDLVFMGGAQDTQQEIVNKDLFENKGKILVKRIETNIPGLFICGAYQFLGKYYKTAEGHKLPGLDLFPLYTENPGGSTQRLIGNIIIKANTSNFSRGDEAIPPRRWNSIDTLVGFENHGGRTYLEDKNLAFAEVLKGYGNNGRDRTEGILYKNAIGSYLHGPILPKNPELADWLIEKALEIKYKTVVELPELDNVIEKKAREVIVKRFLAQV